MIEDEDSPLGPRLGDAANDNGAAGTRLEAAVLTIARQIGRQIAREEFERLSAANDNRPAPKADEQ
jgi:hypothetical protein